MKNNRVMIFLTLICAQNVCAMDRLSAGKKAQKEKMAALQEKRFERRLVRMQQEEARKVAECKARHEAVQQHNLLSNVLPYVYRANGIAHVEHAREQLAALGLVFNDDVCLKTVLTKTLPEVLDRSHGVTFPELVDWQKEKAMLLQIDQLFTTMQQSNIDAAYALIEEGLVRDSATMFRFKVEGVFGLPIPTEAEQRNCIENALEQEKYMPNVYLAAMFYKLQGLYFGRFGYEQNQAEAQRLVEQGLAQKKEWAFLTYIRALRFGDFDIAHNEAEARELIDVCAAQGHKLVLEAKIADIVAGHYGHAMRSNFVQNCATVLRELFQNLRNERKRLASLADTLQK